MSSLVVKTVKLEITKKQFLSWLKEQVGTKESPAGSNNQKYGKAYGMNRVAWCAIFVWNALTDMGKFKTFLKSAYVPDWQNWAIKHGRWHGKSYKAKAGDLVVFQMPGPKRANHIGVVIANRKSPSSKVKTIEGNTGGSNPRAGGMVGAQERATTYVLGFIDLQDMFLIEPKKHPSTFVLKFELKQGTSHHDATKVLQTRLNTLGVTDKYGRKLKVDGDFGASTTQAVNKFKKAHKLKTNGVVGKGTAAALGWKWGA